MFSIRCSQSKEHPVQTKEVCIIANSMEKSYLAIQAAMQKLSSLLSFILPISDSNSSQTGPLETDRGREMHTCSLSHNFVHLYIYQLSLWQDPLSGQKNLNFFPLILEMCSCYIRSIEIPSVYVLERKKSAFIITFLRKLRRFFYSLRIIKFE